MADLTIVAKIIVQPDKAEFVKEEMLKIIPPTRAEEGCVYYNLHQDDNDSSAFVWIEAWASHEAWQAHMNSAHLQQYRNLTSEFVIDRIVTQMTQIG